MHQTAFKYEVQVGTGGKVEVNVPVPPGTTVEVLVLTPEQEDDSDLIGAATTSLDFWDNPWDDEDWNNA